MDMEYTGKRLDVLVKASDSDLDRYRSALSQNLTAIQLTIASLLCTDMCCKDVSDHCAYLLEQLQARACQQLKLLCLTL